MIVENQNVLFKSSFPKWFVILGSICFVITLLFSTLYVVVVIYNNGISVFNMIILILLSSGYWFFIKILFYSITATDRGLKSNNPLGSSKEFIWEEIVEVRRPYFGIPYDLTYVVSKNNGKLLLIRSMQNYKEIIELIKIKAQDLQKCKS